MAALAGRWERRLGVGVSARLVSRICSAPPPPVSVSREQAACLARLGFLPIFPLCQTEEEGSREGESSGKLPRGKAGQQRKQEKYIFLSLLSPSKALYSFLFLRASHSPGFSSSLLPCLSHFVLLSPKPLIPLLLPHTHSLILKLFFSTSPLSIVLPVPLCYSPPPSSFCLSHLNMPPLSITPLHTPDDCSTPYFFSPSFSSIFLLCFCCSVCCLCHHLRILFCATSPPLRRSWPRLWMRCCSIHWSAWLRCFHHSWCQNKLIRAHF